MNMNTLIGNMSQNPHGIFGNRWIQLTAGFIAMVVISNYQYAFTLFTDGIGRDFPNVSYAAISTIYSLFIAFETWPVPLSGFLIDRLGIRNLMIIGSIMIAIGWVGSALANSIILLYIFYGVIAGTGAGIIYIACSGNAIKWFPDKRGLAVGITAAGFGGGAAITVIPISMMISASGWRYTILVFGIVQGIIALLMALIMRHPPENYKPKGWDEKLKVISKRLTFTKRNYDWYDTIRRPEFWLLYAMFVMTATGGLLATGNLTQIAKSIGISKAVILGVSVVALSQTINGINNGVSRILWGSISDRLGRENTMTLVFLIEALFVFLITTFLASNPLLFVILMGIAFLSWGEIFSLYSSITGDIFGPKYATTNYGMLYTAKGVAAQIAGWGAALIAAALNSWIFPLYIAVILDVITALLAIFVLKRTIRNRVIKEEAKEEASRERTK
jgi:OFA family oxalate/formate antiporter-like MFS transporter